MGLRFRKSVKIAPGVRLNVGKKSTGISIGGKGGGVSFNSKTGAHARVSAPGTGLSYTTKLSGSKKRSKDSDLDLWMDRPEKDIYTEDGNSDSDFVMCMFDEKTLQSLNAAAFNDYAQRVLASAKAASDPSSGISDEMMENYRKELSLIRAEATRRANGGKPVRNKVKSSPFVRYSDKSLKTFSTLYLVLGIILLILSVLTIPVSPVLFVILLAIGIFELVYRKKCVAEIKRRNEKPRH